ncbi:hypothetical protein RFI_00036 [Reticulomyxa filosa]|uniref:Uncharacterized protein n=1 Tax=Reticulomyxa filosa TaxID=46433 RepID=X6PH55_RETFI|nr:hypothetical protein RFI_00036 [Reticulomyxa filosa]|eukprot:ETO37027.1 hypothetical protein RFI_00036 [Reticulomyxa filosa]
MSSSLANNDVSSLQSNKPNSSPHFAGTLGQQQYTSSTNSLSSLSSPKNESAWIGFGHPPFPVRSRPVMNSALANGSDMSGWSTTTIPQSTTISSDTQSFLSTPQPSFVASRNSLETLHFDSLSSKPFHPRFVQSSDDSNWTVRNHIDFVDKQQQQQQQQQQQWQQQQRYFPTGKSQWSDNCYANSDIPSSFHTEIPTVTATTTGTKTEVGTDFSLEHFISICDDLDGVMMMIATLF